MGGFVRAALVCCVFLCGTACATSVTPAPVGIAPDRVLWCSQPVMAFEDDGVSPSATITDWPTAQRVLDFAPVLPPRLPVGACLAAAGGVVRNPIFGGRFIITYELANGGALSLAESPKQQDLPAAQCSAGAAATIPIITCQQTLQGLDITLTSTQSVASLRALLATFRSGITWVPRSTPTVATTP